MKRLLRKKTDPPQQSAPLPTAQKSPQSPPPLFARFASSQSSGSPTSPPVISGPTPLAPRDSLNRQSGPHVDESPPKPNSIRVVSGPIQRNRKYEKQRPASGGSGRDDKPLPDIEQSPPLRVNPHTFYRGPGQPFEPRTPPTAVNDQPQKPQKSIPEFRKRDDPPRNAEFTPVPLDASPIMNRSGGTSNKLTRTPLSSSPERKHSSARSAPTPDLTPSGLLPSQNPPDRPQPRRKYSPLEAFGLVSGENSPVPSTTTSSVNLPSQNSNSEPLQPAVPTTSSDSPPSSPGEVIPTAPDIDSTVRNHDPRRESYPTGLGGHPTTPNPEKHQRPQTADSSNESHDSRMRTERRVHHPLGPRSSINRGPVQGQPRIFASMNTGSDFQQEPFALKQGQPRIFATGNGQDSQPWNTNGPQSLPGYGRGNQSQEPPTAYNTRTEGIKGKSVDRSGVNSVPGSHQHHNQPEGQREQRDNQTSSRGQMGEIPIRTVYTRAKSPAMQYRESLEKGKDDNGPAENGPAEPQSHRPLVRRPAQPHPPPVPLRKNSSGSSDGPQQRFMGPRSRQMPDLNGDGIAPKPNRRQSLYSPAVNITTNLEEPVPLNEPLIPSPKPSPNTTRSFGQQQRSVSTQHEPGRYQSPSTPSSFKTENNPPTTNGHYSLVVNGSSPEPPQSRDPRGQSSWHVQSSTTTQDPSRNTSITSSTSVSSDRDRNPGIAETQPTQNRPQKPTKLRRPDNTRPPPTHYQSQERLGTGAVPTNRGSQMDSFYQVDASLPGTKKPNTRHEEEETRPYPFELHLLRPQLLRALLQYLSFYDWCILQGVSKNLRSQLSHTKELKEEVLERYLSTSGYVRWVWEEKEPLVVSLRDLNEYMRGVSLPTHEYARIADNYLHARVSTVSKEERAMHTDQARAMSFATRAYSRIIVRLRAQAEAVMAYGGAVSKIPGGPVMGSRAPSPSSYDIQFSRPSNGQRGRMVFASPIFQPKRAPLLRVFVPSPEDWLSDASVVECESELNRAGILHMLRPGDTVWDIAVGDEGNAGRMVWDGNFLLDLDYTYSASGDLPRYLPSLAFAPSYFHRVLRISGNPVVHLDLNPWSEEIAMNLQLLQDRVKTETPQGTYHNVIRWVHRSTFQIYPQSSGKRLPFQFGSSAWHVDPGWYGTIVVEAEGTNEGLADLQSRCHSAFPGRNESEGQGSRDEERRRVFRILRERSKPGEIWIRTVGDKERWVP